MSPERPRRMQAFDVRVEVHVEASTARVWQALTEQGREWWPARLYHGGTPRGFVIEPHVGGRVFEDWGNGEGNLRGSVVAFREGAYLEWAGDRDADRGGPARSLTAITLEPDGTGTRLRLRDTPFGWLPDDLEPELRREWEFLLAECLRPFVEQSRRPARPATVE